ncbi:hypothetical protein [Bradyrhizobium sp. 21]|uniref:hypothetical protein n=1 Tax=Bradyrhizobium sp. 21 TaxID=2782666 RepID=UPI001FFABADC|nr:hypothetical protein [Bradyrhizobium sp. 21]MCK1386545.1 hypothetical protein [Bradyrhizobium sp. 21]
MHWLGWLLDYLMVFGFAHHLWETGASAVEHPSPGGLLIAAGAAALLFGHFGRSETSRLGRLLSAAGRGVAAIGQFLQNLPDKISALLHPPQTNLERLHREAKLERRANSAITAVVLTSMGGFLAIFVYAALFLPSPPIPIITSEHNKKKQKELEPFDKRWQAPNEKTGMGGDANVDIPPPDQIDFNAVIEPIPLPRSRPKRLEAKKPMKDPWLFPRF